MHSSILHRNTDMDIRIEMEAYIPYLSISIAIVCNHFLVALFWHLKVTSAINFYRVISEKRTLWDQNFHTLICWKQKQLHNLKVDYLSLSISRSYDIWFSTVEMKSPRLHLNKTITFYKSLSQSFSFIWTTMFISSPLSFRKN